MVLITAPALVTQAPLPAKETNKTFRTITPALYGHLGHPRQPGTPSGLVVKLRLDSELLPTVTQVFIADLQDLGFRINPRDTVTQPARHIRFLRFVLDMTQHSLSTTTQRVTSLRDTLGLLRLQRQRPLYQRLAGLWSFFFYFTTRGFTHFARFSRQPPRVDLHLFPGIFRAAPLICRKLKTRYDSYSHFYVAIDDATYEKLRDPSFWPKSCLFKPFRGGLRDELLHASWKYIVLIVIGMEEKEWERAS
ncbi:hypothetical protein HPB47_017644 [Ixodes persulcatus]|uniref:Uncharacterized protein n=1 Tax=Ixodes persulcatus TaxID=34615 RepID=A0AC60QMS6_IXOPE|nr:hypothetical protein HPB47_017644 [Ixodes persulcatus]